MIFPLYTLQHVNPLEFIPSYDQKKKLRSVIRDRFTNDKLSKLKFVKALNFAHSNTQYDKNWAENIQSLFLKPSSHKNVSLFVSQYFPPPLSTFEGEGKRGERKSHGISLSNFYWPLSESIPRITFNV